MLISYTVLKMDLIQGLIGVYKSLPYNIHKIKSRAYRPKLILLCPCKYLFCSLKFLWIAIILLRELSTLLDNGQKDVCQLLNTKEIHYSTCTSILYSKLNAACKWGFLFYEWLLNSEWYTQLTGTGIPSLSSLSSCLKHWIFLHWPQIKAPDGQYKTPGRLIWNHITYILSLLW